MNSRRVSDCARNMKMSSRILKRVDICQTDWTASVYVMYFAWCTMVRLRRGFVWWPLLIILGWCAGLQGNHKFNYPTPIAQHHSGTLLESVNNQNVHMPVIYQRFEDFGYYFQFFVLFYIWFKFHLGHRYQWRCLWGVSICIIFLYIFFIDWLVP